MNFEMQKFTKFSFWLLENLQIFLCVHLLIFVKSRATKTISRFIDTPHKIFET